MIRLLLLLLCRREGAAAERPYTQHAHVIIIGYVTYNSAREHCACLCFSQVFGGSLAVLLYVHAFGCVCMYVCVYVRGCDTYMRTYWLIDFLADTPLYLFSRLLYVTDTKTNVAGHTYDISIYLVFFIHLGWPNLLVAVTFYGS